MFRYEPDNEKDKDAEKKKPNYYFLNSSGNSIKKESNYQLVEKHRNRNLEDEFDEEENQEDRKSVV